MWTAPDVRPVASIVCPSGGDVEPSSGLSVDMARDRAIDGTRSFRCYQPTFFRAARIIDMGPYV